MNGMLNIAIKAAREAGIIMMRSINRLESIRIKEKGVNNYVSSVDLNVESFLVDYIQKFFPDHAILSEEVGAIGDNEYTWIIDPIDGTSNYLHSFPHFAVSIAIRHEGIIEHGVVYNPFRQELFVASRGNGSTLNDQKIRVSKTLKLTNALVSMAFHCQTGMDLSGSQLLKVQALLNNVSGIRTSGSAALDLCYVASGRTDAFWENNLKPWDVAAAGLILEEAGGLISDIDETQNYIYSGSLVSGNPKIYEQLISLLRETG
jgi:myo-inositol-1(or 4)-monophosphatase